MPKKTKLNIKGNEVKVEEGDDSFIGKLMAGCKGKIKINTPFGKREVKLVKRFKKEKVKEKKIEAKTR